MQISNLGDIYVLLLHGRIDPNEDMTAMGFNGPKLGPFKSIHFTYATHVRCMDVHGEELWLEYHEDMLVHEGKFYGDFEIATNF
jgi:hypothetical protein